MFKNVKNEDWGFDNSGKFEIYNYNMFKEIENGININDIVFKFDLDCFIEIMTSANLENYFDEMWDGYVTIFYCFKNYIKDKTIVVSKVI